MRTRILHDFTFIDIDKTISYLDRFCSSKYICPILRVQWVQYRCGRSWCRRLRGRGHGKAVEDVLKVVRPAHELSLALGADLAQTCKRWLTMFDNSHIDRLIQ